MPADGALIRWLRREPRGADAALSVTVGDRVLPVELRRHASARRMTMRLAPDGSAVRVSLPRWGRAAEALAFARERSDWLEHQLATLPARAAPQAGGMLPYRGAHLAIEWRATAPRRPALAENTITVGGPEATVPGRLQRWLESEAERLMAADLAEYCARLGQPAPRLRLSRAQRRWGSCAADGTIRINWRLIMAPDAVRRSVVAHEVAHLAHFDHSPAFHATLGRLFEGDIDDANRWLKREGRALYARFG